MLGGLPIARFGNEAQRARWLPGLASGAHLLTAALQDAGSEDPAAPATTARRDGTDFLLTGVKRLVPAASRAARIVVPAATGDGVALFLVDPNAAGVRLTAQRTSIQEPLFDLALDGVRVARADVFGDAAAACWLRDAALAALCTTQVGVSERALEITAKYLRERVQFGVPIGSFQSVQHRAADCWIDAQAMRWTAWRAATRLVEGSDVSRDTAVAKLWAAEGGSRDRERRAASARRHRRGRRLLDPPLLPVVEVARADAGFGGAASRPPRPHPRKLASGGAGMKTRSFDSVAVGDALPELAIPVTVTLVVGGALASRDYTPVHHDKAAAQAQGMSDVFMNILTTNGLVGRYVTDWAGPDATVKNVAIKLGAPNLPGDTMKMVGSVKSKDAEQGEVVVEVAGKNGWGNHVTGTIRVALPRNA